MRLNFCFKQNQVFNIYTVQADIYIVQVCTQYSTTKSSLYEVPLGFRLKMQPKLLHCEKKLTIFPSPAGMSLTKLSLAGNSLIIPGQGEFGK
jgi:hypothetical protein